GPFYSDENITRLSYDLGLVCPPSCNRMLISEVRWTREVRDAAAFFILLVGKEVLARNQLDFIPQACLLPLDHGVVKQLARYGQIKYQLSQLRHGIGRFG